MPVDADAVTSAVQFGSNDSGVFTDVLRAFLSLLRSGGEQVIRAEMELCVALLSLQLLKALVSSTTSRGNMVGALWSFLGASAWYTAAINSPELVHGWMQWMGSIGAQAAGGGSYNHVSMDNPSLILNVGMKAIKAISIAIEDMGILDAGLTYAFMIGGVWMLIGAFIFLGCVAVVVTVQAYLKTVVGIALFPFAIEPGTRFLASPGISLIIDGGITLGTASMVIGTGYGFFQRIVPGPGGADISYVVRMCSAVVLISVLAGCAAVLGARASGAATLAMSGMKFFK